MKISLYREIIARYQSLNKRNCLKDLLKDFPDVSEDTMDSIIFQEYQRKMQRTHWIHKQPEKMYQYYLSYCDAAENDETPGFLVKIADEADLAPSLMARLILEQYYKTKNPDLKENVVKEKVEDHIKDTSLIEDGQLALEVSLCNQQDEYYGPVADAIRSSCGAEYESNLKKELKRLGVDFLQETSLRVKGFDKTPDIRLERPIGIGDRTVNWIESKASFGDVDRHKEYLTEQYGKYKRRFGPGLVIYWFGFIDELSAYKRKKLIISDHMPTNITFMNPLQDRPMIHFEEEDGDLADTKQESS